MADHFRHVGFELFIERKLAFLDLDEGGQQDGDLRQTGGIFHDIAVDGCHAGLLEIGDVHQGDRQPLLRGGFLQPLGLNQLRQLRLQPRVDAFPQQGIRVCPSGRRRKGQRGKQDGNDHQGTKSRLLGHGTPRLGCDINVSGLRL